jgi:fimbrial isopeptide formation D2 family protein/LPXTG-motif cell wall-anchored protein
VSGEQSMSRSITKRAGAVLGVLVLGVIAAVGGVALPASAAPGNIDPTIPRTLTIHKYQLSATSPQAPGTGQVIPGGIPGGIPMEGAQFTVRQVPSVDLLTPQGWTTAASLTPQTAAPLATGTPVVGTTNAAGVVSFSTLPVGLYLVTETQPPATVTDPVAPFLVTLPFPTGASGSPANDWIYDVHVYPKNSVTELTKTRVVPPAGSVEARNPDLVRWAINATIPSLPSGTPLSQFVLSDQISTGLEFVATPPTGVTATAVTATNASGGNVALTAGTDYTLATSGTTQTATFTPAGRTKLTGAQGGTVSFNVLTRAVSVPGGGLITNTATSQINGATETVTGTTPIGQLTVFSYAVPPTPGGTQTPLAGAVYQVFLTEGDAQAGINPISVGGVNQWTSGTNGLISIPALVPGTYVVREITPPAGFQLPSPAILPTQVVAGPTSTSAPVQNYLTVPHSQVPAWALPLTGGDGAVWFGIGGGAVLVIALGAAIVVARRRAALARTTA